MGGLLLNATMVRHFIPNVKTFIAIDVDFFVVSRIIISFPLEHVFHINFGVDLIQKALKEI